MNFLDGEIGRFSSVRSWNIEELKSTVGVMTNGISIEDYFLRVENDISSLEETELIKYIDFTTGDSIKIFLSPEKDYHDYFYEYVFVSNINGVEIFSDNYPLYSKKEENLFTDIYNELLLNS